MLSSSQHLRSNSQHLNQLFTQLAGEDWEESKQNSALMPDHFADFNKKLMGYGMMMMVMMMMVMIMIVMIMMKSSNASNNGSTGG